MRHRPPASLPDRWLVLSLAAPAGERHLLVEALRRLGGRLVEREGERLVTYLPPPADLEALLAEARAAVRASTSLQEPSLEWRWEPHAAWAARWRRDVAPRRVTERMVVAPAGAEIDTAPGELVVWLTPGPAFGTAEHATTRACLRLLERRLRPGDEVLDVGAGSGILAVAAALLGARRALALEMDGGACAVARENAALNGVAARVEVREVEVRPTTLRRAGRFGGVLANLQTEVLLPLLPGLAAAVAPGGWLVVSGVPRMERAAALAAAAAAGLALVEEAIEDGWWTASLAPRTPSRAESGAGA